MSEFRRPALYLTIGSFSVAALLGVLALLSSGDFGAGQVRVLVTTLCVGVTSVLTLCYLAGADSAYRLVGALGALAAVPTLGLALALTWTDAAQDSEHVWEAFGIGSVVSITLAQATMLLVLAAAAGPFTRALLVGTLGAATMVALQVSTLIVNADAGDGLLRFLGVVAILDVFGTVAVAALARFGRAVPPAPMDADAVDTPQGVRRT